MRRLAAARRCDASRMSKRRRSAQSSNSAALKRASTLACAIGHPFTEDALEQIARDGITELIVLPLYPQFSISTTGSSLKEFVALLDRRGGLRHIRRRYITRWHTNDLYLNALTEQISEEIGKFPDSDPRQVHLLFSAHSVPQSYISEGDPYLRHIQETIRLVMERLGNSSPTHLSFQSKVGPVKWLEPSTDHKLRELGAGGVPPNSSHSHQLCFRTHRDALRTGHPL